MINGDEIKIASPATDSELTSTDTIIVTDNWPDGSPSNQPSAEAKLEAISPTASQRTNAFIRQSSRQPSGLSEADTHELEALLGAEDLGETDPCVTGQASRLNLFRLHAPVRSTSGSSLPNNASPEPK